MGTVGRLRILRLAGLAVLLAGCCLVPAGCRSVTDKGNSKEDGEAKTGGDKKKKTEEKKTEDKKDAAAKPEDAGAADVGFLLTMTYGEAKKLSPQSMELPPFYKVAADEITVVSTKPDGTPKRVRAKGHVFLQIDYREELSGLAQEALIGGSEAILRGKPLLRRGRSVVEGLADRTVFYVEGLRLQVIGLHRITTGSGVTPAWRGSWKDGPNPLLPALSPDDVPKEMRASPLLPPLSKDDRPKKPR
jgi:hypothetical protein